jgi:putative peptide zinc metalloprotease protein
MLSEDFALPAIRDDIQLHEAPTEDEGSPCWTLYDPAANKYYKIGWLEFEILSRFRSCQSVNQVVQKVKEETALEPDGEIVQDLVEFLLQHSLVYTSGEEALERFEEQRDIAERPWWSKLMHGYLFFSFPICKPETFLNKTYPLLRPFFSRPFMVAVLMLLTYGIFLSIQRFDEITNTFINYLNIEGIILFVGATIIVKIIHELGHAYTATKYGVPVTTIGVAFIVLYPILYTETTNAWKLKSRNERLVIAGGGMMIELALASVTLLLWHILPAGMGQSLCFMIAVVSMLASLIVNLNPLMKFDGYYLFSDLMGIDNLQDRAFAFGKWRLREWLWGWNDPRPEITSPERQRLLIGFAYAVWIYRFFLYLGIALLIYHLFFQPLGLIFMIIELIFFIGLPLWREVKIWLGRSGDIFKSLHGKISLLLIITLLALTFVPMKKSVEIPVVLHAKDYKRFFPPIAAKLDQIYVKKGDEVQEGDILFQLSSYDLDHNINITRLKLNDLEKIRESSQATLELANQRAMINSEIKNTREALNGFLEIKKQLVIKAPFSSTVEMIDPNLKSGQWVNEQFMLALLADKTSKILSGYVGEQEINKLGDITQGTFYPDYSPFETYDVRLNQVGETSVSSLFWPELSSSQGGPIPAEASQEGLIRPLPRYTVYSIDFELNEGQNVNSLTNFIARGTVIMEGESQTLSNILIKKAFSVFIMDSGL